MQTPSKKTVSKRKISPKQVPKQGPAEDEPEDPNSKKAAPTTSKLAQISSENVVQGKIVKGTYLQKQGLEVFLDKLRPQGWLEMFTNTQLGCSVPDLAEFYANCNVTNAVVTSEVIGKKLKFNAKDLGVILGVPAEGFDVYVREDKTMLGTARLLQLTQNTEPANKIESPPVR